MLLCQGGEQDEAVCTVCLWKHSECLPVVCVYDHVCMHIYAYICLVPVCAACACLLGVYLQPHYWLDLGHGDAAASPLLSCPIQRDLFSFEFELGYAWVSPRYYTLVKMLQKPNLLSLYLMHFRLYSTDLHTFTLNISPEDHFLLTCICPEQALINLE